MLHKHMGRTWTADCSMYLVFPSRIVTV